MGIGSETFEKDNYTCKICGRNSRELIHKLFHNIYGKKNNTLKQLEEFKLNYGVMA